VIPILKSKYATLIVLLLVAGAVSWIAYRGNFQTAINHSLVRNNGNELVDIVRTGSGAVVFYGNPAARETGVAVFTRGVTGWRLTSGSSIKSQAAFTWGYIGLEQSGMDASGVLFGSVQDPAVTKVEISGPDGVKTEAVMKDTGQGRLWYSLSAKPGYQDANVVCYTSSGEIKYQRNS
jgi:hypothetical protein